MAARVPDVPQEHSIIEAVRRLEKAGYDAQMAVKSNALVFCYSCNQASDAREVHMTETFRSEGSSDPNEMAVIAGIQCPKCNAKGTLVVPYGPTANADDAAAFRRLIDDRSVQAHG